MSSQVIPKCHKWSWTRENSGQSNRDRASSQTLVQPFEYDCWMLLVGRGRLNVGRNRCWQMLIFQHSSRLLWESRARIYNHITDITTYGDSFRRCLSRHLAMPKTRTAPIRRVGQWCHIGGWFSPFWVHSLLSLAVRRAVLASFNLLMMNRFFPIVSQH